MVLLRGRWPRENSPPAMPPPACKGKADKVLLEWELIEGGSRGAVTMSARGASSKRLGGVENCNKGHPF